jgi:hypothetical protein
MTIYNWCLFERNAKGITIDTCYLPKRNARRMTMDILYVCTKDIQRSYMKAILNRICIINNIDPYVRAISIYSKKFHQLKNNIFLLLDKIRKIIVFK